MSSSSSRPEPESSPPQTRVASGCGSSPSDLRRIFNLAREFAGKIQYTLNATICTDASINAQEGRLDKRVVIIGNRLTRHALTSEHIQIGRRGRPRGWLKVEYKVRFDEEIRYLMVETAFVGVYAADKTPLCHFDYERNKTDGYPEAHVQVYGTSEALPNWGDRFVDRGLHRLHLPAGHRRFRWTLEDVVEFLITEGLAEAHTEQWQEVLEPGRREFMRHQLRAAIRNDTETAVMYLSEQNFDIRPPKDP